MTKTCVALIHDRVGVLNRVVSVFRRHGANIESLTVTRTSHPGVSRMTCVLDTHTLAPIIGQLRKLPDVLDVHTDASVLTPPSTLAVPQADGTT